MILVPIFMMVLGFLLQSPFSVISASAILSLFVYSRINIYKNLNSLEISEKVGSGLKSVDDRFVLRQTISTRRPLKIRGVSVNEEGIKLVKDKSIDAYTPMELKHNMVPRRRGYLKVGGFDGWAYDPMGLYRIPLKREPTKSITIHSSKDTIRRARAYAKRSHVEELIKDFHMYTTTSGELEEIREYVPGDSLRNIHWKSFSKFQKHMTKVYEKMAMVEVHVFMDCGPSMRRYTISGSEKMEHSIFLTLEILKKFEIAGHDIGLTVYDHKNVLFHHPPDHRRSTYQRIFESMSALPPPIKSDGYASLRYDQEIDVPALLEAEREFAKRIGGVTGDTTVKELAGIVNAVRMMSGKVNKRSLIIIISDLEMNPGLTIKAVEKLKVLGNVVWVIVPFSPWYEVDDVDTETLEKAYIDYEHLERTLLKLHRAGASVFELYPQKEGLKILLERRDDKR